MTIESVCRLFQIEGDYRFSSSNFIGEVEDTTVIPKVGSVLSLLQSKWGFLFTVLVPCFLIFIYEVYSLIIEIKYGAEPDFFIDEPVKSEPEKKQTPKKNSTKKTTTTKKRTTKTAKQAVF